MKTQGSELARAIEECRERADQRVLVLLASRESRHPYTDFLEELSGETKVWWGYQVVRATMENGSTIEIRWWSERAQRGIHSREYGRILVSAKAAREIDYRSYVLLRTRLRLAPGVVIEMSDVRGDGEMLANEGDMQ